MAAYLSDDWVRSLDEALAGVPPGVAEPGGSTRVQFEVRGTPDGDRCWHLALGPGGARAVVGPAADPSVTFSQPWSTAVAVARARRPAQEALLAGDIRVSGDPARLLPWRGALQAVEASVAELNASTTFPADDEPEA